MSNSIKLDVSKLAALDKTKWKLVTLLLRKNLIWQVNYPQGKKYLHYAFKYNKNLLKMERVLRNQHFEKTKAQSRDTYRFAEDKRFVITMMSSSGWRGTNAGKNFEFEVFERLLNTKIDETPVDCVEDVIVRKIMAETKIHRITHVELSKKVSNRDDLRDAYNTGELKLLCKNIGNTIKDITIKGTDEKGVPKGPFYLSLKQGNLFKYVNLGLRRFFTGNDKQIASYPITSEEAADPSRGDYANSGDNLNKFGEQLLTMLGMPKPPSLKSPGRVYPRDLYFRVFNEYKKPGVNERIDIILHPNFNLLKLIRASVGYGYVFVHRPGNKDEQTIVSTNSLIGIMGEYCAITKVEGHFNIGTSKQVEIDIHLQGRKGEKILKAVFRHTHGGVIPSMFMIDSHKKA